MPRAILYDFVTGAEIPLNAPRRSGVYGLGALLHPDAKAEELLREHQRLLETRARARKGRKRAGETK